MVSEAPVVDGLDDAALLGLLVEVVGRLGRQELGGAVDDGALTASVKVLHRAETMVAAEKLRRVGAVDARAAYTAHGVRSTADLLTGFGLTRGEARGQEQTARALSRLPAMADRFARGQLGAGQAAVAARALADLPAGEDRDADRAAVGELDRLVANEGVTKDRRELGRTVDRWAHQRRADGDPLAERERRAHQRRHLWAGRTADGDLVLEGRLTPVVHARLGALLDPLARPSGPDDPRSSGQRRHDALGHLLDLAAGITDRHPPDGRSHTDRGGPDGRGSAHAGDRDGGGRDGHGGGGAPNCGRNGHGGAHAGSRGGHDDGGAPDGNRHGDDRGAHTGGGGGGGEGWDRSAAGVAAVPGGVQVLLVTTP